MTRDGIANDGIDSGGIAGGVALLIVTYTTTKALICQGKRDLWVKRRVLFCDDFLSIIHADSSLILSPI
jgi:hypothetical protein